MQMLKVLRAYGPAGRKGDDWNWCPEGEPVGVDGFVCSNSCSCGCGRAFTGIESRKSCTRAVVSEVSFREYVDLCRRVRKAVFAAWDDSESIAVEAMRCFDELSRAIHFPVGTVLRVEKHGDTVSLVKDHPI